VGYNFVVDIMGLSSFI